MYQKKIFFAITLAFIAFRSIAQTAGEAFDFSNGDLQGTARSAGFGNALGSIGGDFGCLSVNPAGIGVYKSSEMSVSPSLKLNGASTQFQGATTTDNGAVLNASHFGFVFTRAPRGKRADRSDWKSVSFGFGMNKTADFTRNYSYGGYNNKTSATLSLESDANLNPGNDSIPGTLGFLGYLGYLINQDSDGKFRTVVPFAGGIDQHKTATVRGGINEYVMTLGGNYRERWLLGVTLGIPMLNYTYTSTYTETTDPANGVNPNNFTSFAYSKSVNTNGVGVNLKLGAIYKMQENFRVGLALHTPTYYSLTETFTPHLVTNLGGTEYVVSADDFPIGSQFDYHLTTPWKSVLSAAYIFGTRGFVTADVEYVDYSSMRFRYPDGFDNTSGMTFQQEESAENDSIKSKYHGAANVRIGGELLLGQGFMVRAGYGFYGNAYKTSEQNSQRSDISLGLGFHFRHFFTDLAWVHSIYKLVDKPYTIDYSGVASTASNTPAPQAQINYQLNSLTWTVGFKFR
jgi:hypothetical protein